MSPRALTSLLIHTFLCFDCVLSFTLKNCTVEFSVTCQSRHLQEIPDDVPLNANVLDVGFNEISRIRSTDLRGFSQLASFSVAHNQLSRIDDEAFVSSNLLKILNLSYNKLTNLTELTFAGLNRLVSLNLLHNHISWIAPNVFQHLSSLKRVNFKFNRINNLTDTAALFKLPDMELISLSSNYFASFSSDDLPFNSSNVRVISLGSNTLRKFSLKRDLFPYLRSLDLSGSKRIEWDVANNSFMSNVTELFLGGGIMKELSDQSLKSLTRLRLLRLSENQLRKVPLTVRELWTLENLDLSYNYIHKIHCLDFANLTKLTTLDLMKNHIVHLGLCIFQNLHNLKTLNIERNNVHTIQNAFRVDMSQLQVLLLTDNQDRFTLQPGEFRNLSSLRSLNLKAAKYILTMSGLFEGLEKLLRLICWTSVVTKEVFVGLRDLRHLELHMGSLFSHTNTNQNSTQEKKRIFGLFICEPLLRSVRPPAHVHTHSAPDQSFHHKLDLSNNKLNTLDFLVDLKALQKLRVSDNQLSVINETVFQTLPSLTYLDVSKNTLLCDCLNAGFLQWVRGSNRTQVMDGAQYRCVSPVTHAEHRFLDFDTRPCRIDFGFILFTTTSSVTLLTMIVSSVYHFLRWQLAYAYYLFLAYLYDTKRRRRRDAAQRYDAFISYNVHDEEWVYNEMLPVLEGEQGWRLCLHHRDFQPGKPIVENITDAIYGSRKTLCVVSRHYLQSEWCSREIQIASVRLFDEQKDVLVLVFLEELPPWHLTPFYQMRRLVKRRSYLSWPRAAQHRAVFWQKLQQALHVDERRIAEPLERL